MNKKGCLSILFYFYCGKPQVQLIHGLRVSKKSGTQRMVNFTLYSTAQAIA